MSISRRNFLKGTAAGAAGTALTGGLLIGGAHADARPVAGAPEVADSYPFHAAHQAGILDPGPANKQNNSCYVAFDLVAGTSRAELADLLRTITARGRALTAGGSPAALGVGQPPADSDVLGPDVPADGLTVTVGFGASLFDERFGLAAARPRKLTPMTTFPNDALEPDWTHGDLLVQLCANHADTVHHALRDITRHTRGAMQPRWKIDGYSSPPRPSGSARNLLGFKDGSANPTGSEAAQLIWVDDPAEPAWAQAGTYQVVRLIRMFVEFWDRVSINEQENMFGRRRDTGAPLDGTVESDDVPDYAADPTGSVIPMDAHIRLANPRTAQTESQRLLRRSYNYDLGIGMNGTVQCGHIFVAYQQDVQRQFETVQRRLVDEPLIDYVQPFGGGYFFVPPGVRDATDWYGRGLFSR